MKLPRQLTSLYHITHYLVLSYFFLIAYPLALRPRAKDDDKAFLFGDGLLLHFGMEVDLFFGMALFFLYDLHRNVGTFNEGMHHFLLDCKILSLLLTIGANADTSFAFGLVALYATMAILLVPPRYDGETKVMKLNKQSFGNKVLDQTKDENDDNSCYYLVMFHNKWDAKCHFFEPQFCQLSVEYHDNHDKNNNVASTPPRIKFASLDVAHCPELACTLMIVDHETGEPHQLPALILFHKGLEVRRLPQLNDMGKAISCSTIDKDLVVSHFELDAISEEPSSDSVQSAFAKKRN